MSRYSRFFLFIVPIVAFFTWAQVKPKPPGSAGTGTSGSYSSLTVSGSSALNGGAYVKGTLLVDGGVRSDGGFVYTGTGTALSATNVASGQIFIDGPGSQYYGYNSTYPNMFGGTAYFADNLKVNYAIEGVSAVVDPSLTITTNAPDGGTGLVINNATPMGSSSGGKLLSIKNNSSELWKFYRASGYDYFSDTGGKIALQTDGTNGIINLSGSGAELTMVSGGYITARGNGIRNDNNQPLILRGGNESGNITALKVYPYTGTTTSSTKLLQMYKDQGTTEVVNVDGIGRVTSADGFTVTSYGAFDGFRLRGLGTGATSLTIDGSSNSAANAAVVKIGARYDMTHLGAKVLSIIDNSAEVAFFDKEGGQGNIKYTDTGGTDTPFGYVTIASGGSTGSFVAATNNYYNNAKCFASITNAPTNPVAVSSCVSDNNKTLSITLTGDPGALGAVVSFYIIRTTTPG